MFSTRHPCLPAGFIFRKQGFCHSLVVKVGEIGTNGAAHQGILGKIHGQPVMVEYALYQFIRTHRIPAQIPKQPDDLLCLCSIDSRQRTDVCGRFRVGRDKQLSFQTAYGIQRIQISFHIVKKGYVIFFL